MNLKKVIAGASVVALVAMNISMSNAAVVTATLTGLNGGTTVAKNTEIASIEVTLPDMAIGDTANVNLGAAKFVYTGTPVLTLADTNVTLNAGVMTIEATTAITAGAKTIAVDQTDTSTNGIKTLLNDGAEVVNGIVAVNPVSKTVEVTATVQPILTMDISATDIALGDLVVNNGTVADASNIKTFDVNTASNAVGGITVALASTGLNGDNGKYIGNFGTGDAVTGVSDYSIASTTTAGGTALTKQKVAATQTILTANDVTKANAKTTVTLAAAIDALVEAGNYSDTLTLTATGTF